MGNDFADRAANYWCTSKRSSSGVPGSRTIPGNVTFGAAGIASLLLGLSAVARDVANVIAVVAFGALNTVPRHMSHTTAGVAGLLGKSATVASTASSYIVGASTCDVASFTTAITLGSCRAVSSTTTASSAARFGVVGAIP